jgi:PPE-repeat protein
MTAPIWMASPPEVHSALLNSGPGPGPLLASAGAWNELSAAYAEVADELRALVESVEAGVWEGPSAQSYVAAHMPYVAWLLDSSADSAQMAAQNEIAATAYTSALAAMPTLPELAANHAVHAVLLATNFFGINTIPIALNEADYVRMWVQAATTMSTYQAVSAAAVTAAPSATPAPQIAKAAATGPPPPLPSWLGHLLAELGYTPPTKVPLPINPNQYPTLGVDFWTSIENSITIGNGEYTIHPGETLGQEVGQQLFYFWYTTKYLLPNELSAIGHGNLSQIFSLNTVAVLFSYVIMRIDNIGAVINYLALNPVYLAPVLPLAAAPLPATGAFAGLAGLADLAQQATAMPAQAPLMPAPLPPPAMTSAPAPSFASAPTPAPAPIAVAGSLAPASPATPAPPPPPTMGPGGFPYLIGDTRMRGEVSARDKADEPLYRSGTKAPAVAAAPIARESTPVRRRRRAKTEMLGRGYEYMDLEPESEATIAASFQGAGPLGFTRTTPVDAVVRAGGLATLAGDTFRSGPTLPMTPSTWSGEFQPTLDPEERRGH